MIRRWSRRLAAFLVTRQTLLDEIEQLHEENQRLRRTATR